MESQPSPPKLYYRIGEVAELIGVKTHVLRYWESEFGLLSPGKNEGNQRSYTQRDLQKIQLIKRLLHEEGFTIAGARRRLREEWKSTQQKPSPRSAPAPEDTRSQLLARVRAELTELLNLLR